MKGKILLRDETKKIGKPRGTGRCAVIARKAKTYADLLRLAEEYGVDDNALFLSAAKEYEIQRKVISTIEEALSNGDPIVVKEYVKGRENTSAHPLIKELPKHIDSANKTLRTMLDIIEGLGVKKSVGNKLDEFLSEK